MEPKYQCQNVVATGHTTENLSRMSLLRWLNDLLGTKLRKVEELCSGAIYCQILNILFPGCINLKKIKFEATQTHEFWTNFKQLQIGFRAVGCEKDILIDTLIQGKFQDNFEFLQWFKRFYDANAAANTVPPPTSAAVSNKPPTYPSSSSESAKPSIFTPNPTYGFSEKHMKEKYLSTQVEEYQGKAEKLQEERDFFFNKLRNIEILCTSENARTTPKEVLANKILAELWETSEGFAAPESEED